MFCFNSATFRKMRDNRGKTKVVVACCHLESHQKPRDPSIKSVATLFRDFFPGIDNV
jgi:hypothetical protein